MRIREAPGFTYVAEAGFSSPGLLSEGVIVDAHSAAQGGEVRSRSAAKAITVGHRRGVPCGRAERDKLTSRSRCPRLSTTTAEMHKTGSQSVKSGQRSASLDGRTPTLFSTKTVQSLLSTRVTTPVVRAPRFPRGPRSASSRVNLNGDNCTRRTSFPSNDGKSSCETRRQTPEPVVVADETTATGGLAGLAGKLGNLSRACFAALPGSLSEPLRATTARSASTPPACVVASRPFADPQILRSALHAFRTASADPEWRVKIGTKSGTAPDPATTSLWPAFADRLLSAAAIADAASATAAFACSAATRTGTAPPLTSASSMSSLMALMIKDEEGVQ